MTTEQHNEYVKYAATYHGTYTRSKSGRSKLERKRDSVLQYRFCKWAHHVKISQCN